MLQLTGKNNTTVDVMLDEVEESVITQLYNMLNSDVFINSKVKVMPDCLSINTEVLTKSGFKYIKDLSINDEIMLYNPNTGKAKIGHPKNIIRRQLRDDEKMYKFGLNKFNMSILTTENHRNAIRNNLGILTKDIHNIKTKDFIFNANGIENNEIYDVLDDELRLLVWIIGDGNIKITHNSHTDSMCIRFGLKKERKIKRILELCKNINLHPYIKHTEKQFVIQINVTESKKFLELLHYKKTYPSYWPFVLSDHQASVVLEEAIQVDGDYEAYIKKRGMRFNTSIELQANTLAAIASMHCGKATINKREYISNFTNKPVVMYYVSVIKESELLYSKSGLHNLNILKEEINNYNDDVVCLECETGFFIAKQNNIVFVTGNCHAGKGSVVGLTATIEDRVCPNVVGVDIGCGIYSWNLGKIKPSFEHVDNFIRNHVPYGFNINEKKSKEYNEKTIKIIFKNNELKELCDFVNVDYDKVLRSIGSLGGGNHFIELGIDPKDNIWLSIHSGSRNFGLQVATFFQKMAKAKCNENGLHVAKDLEYLMLNDGGDKYLEAMKIAQTVAHLNRLEMASRIIDFLSVNPSEWIFSVHNYIDLSDKIIRKGAIRAMEGEKVVIPFNMRDGIAVATGKGNSDWNYSAPHGAGRILSRSQAKKELNLEDYKDDMDGIYSSCVTNSTLDESPRVYKDKELILNAIVPTVNVDFLIKPIYNFKGN